jgi:hypothetical protein
LWVNKMANNQPTQIADPYADIATPTVAVAPTASATASADPYADIAVPTPAAPEPSTLSKIGGAVQSVADFVPNAETGFIKGVGDTVSGVAHLINKIPGVGETLSPAQGTAALDQMTTAHGASEYIGKGAEGVAEFVAGDAALEGVAKAAKLVELANNFPLVADALDLAKSHPWLADIISSSVKGAMKGAVVGGVQGTVKGAQTDNAAAGGVGGAIGGGVVGGLMGGLTSDSIRVNPFRNPAAADAATAVRGGVQASTEAAGTATPSVAANILKNPIAYRGASVVDEPLSTLATTEKAAYKRLDEAAGFDLKDAKDQLKLDLRAAKQPGVAPAELNSLQNRIAANTDHIAQAEKNLADQGIDPKEGDTLHTKRMAGQDFKNALQKATNTDGTLDVDKLDKNNQRLMDNKRGNRLVQFMGEDGANAYLDDIAAAKKSGQRAVNAQQLLKKAIKVSPYVATAAGALGTAYELATK